MPRARIAGGTGHRGLDARSWSRAVTHAYPDKTVHLRFYRCAWVRHEPQALGCLAAAWVERDDLGKYDFPAADARLLRKLQESFDLWPERPVLRELPAGGGPPRFGPLSLRRATALASPVNDDFCRNSSTMVWKSFSPTLTMPISRRAFSSESLAWAALTMMVWPNSRRIEPGGAFDGSVGPSTSRILRTASTPFVNQRDALLGAGLGFARPASHSQGARPDMNLTMFSNWLSPKSGPEHFAELRVSSRRDA